MTYYNIQLEALVFFLQTVRSKLRLITEIQEKVFSLKIISKKKNIYTKNHSHTNYNKAKLEILIQPIINIHTLFTWKLIKVGDLQLWGFPCVIDLKEIFKKYLTTVIGKTKLTRN